MQPVSREEAIGGLPTRWLRIAERSRLAQFAVLLVTALLFRGAALGEWNYDTDEQFYALVGRRLLDGATLYVDIWDRKPPALYLVYAAIALLSRSVLAFQLAALLSAALGAYGICRIARLFSNAGAGLMAGAVYLAMLGRFGGATGQAPVWYTTLMIFAAWTIVTRMQRLREGRVDAVLALGMAAAGLAIAFKQSAAIECLFFGGFVTTMLVHRRHDWRTAAGRVALLATMAAVPMLATFAWYWHIGHLGDLWQAIVRSNFARMYVEPGERIWRFVIMLSLLGLPLLFTLCSWLALTRDERRDVRIVFIAAWAVVAVAAVAVFPNIFYHYAIPILPPLCILSAVFFARSRMGRIGFATVVAIGLFNGNTLNLTTRLRAHQVAAPFVEYVRAQTPRKRLLVWGYPNYLYVLVGATPPGPLAFPPHLYDGTESGASGIDEVEEVRHIIAGQPETVVVQNPLVAWPVNQANVDQVNAYLKTCRTLRRFTIYDHLGPQEQDVHSRCGDRR